MVLFMKNRISDYLLISDMDGTLLDDERNISERNLKAIRRFCESGGRFSIATGRSVESVRPYVEKLGVNVPVVLCNGSMVYDFADEKILHQDTMPASVEHSTYRIIDRFPELGAEAYVGTGIYVLQNNSYISRHKLIERIRFEYTIRENIPVGWNKVIMAAEMEQLGPVERYASSLNLPEARLVKSAPEYLELLPKYSSKGTGLRHLADILGVDMKKTVAVGDYYNDAEMIEQAGLGVFVDNAPQELKDTADMVVCHYRDGAVAAVIEHIESLCQ